MIGQRGVPATSGGIERHVEEIGARLVDLGHDVLVYCRPTYSTQRPDTLSWHALEVRLDRRQQTLRGDRAQRRARSRALREGVDMVHYHALGPGLLAPVPRLFFRAVVVQTVHGLDQQRAKWRRTAAALCSTSGAGPARGCRTATVVVSHALRDYYLSTSAATPTTCATAPRSAVAAAGGNTERPRPDPRGYVLFVGRLVPEKAPDLLVRAFARIDRPDLRLVLVGGSSFTDEFVAEPRTACRADPRVVFAGRLHGEPLCELYANAGAFVLPSDLEGMPLTLLEAAGDGAHCSPATSRRTGR